MGFVQADIDAVNAAIASGELTVQYSDKRVTYRSIAELERARSLMQVEVDGVKVARQRRYRTTSGWD